MHTNHTTNYELSQFIATDKPTFLGDYNGDMLKIDTAIKGVATTATAADGKADLATQAASDAASAAATAGTTATTASANATAAVTTANNAATAAASASTAASAADTKAGNALTAIGDLTNLTTTDKTSIVNAINEVNAKSADDISYDNTTSGLLATNVQDAIDELKALIPVAPVVNPIIIEGDTINYNCDNTLTTGTNCMEFTYPNAPYIYGVDLTDASALNILSKNAATGGSLYVAIDDTEAGHIINDTATLLTINVSSYSGLHTIKVWNSANAKIEIYSAYLN